MNYIHIDTNHPTGELCIFIKDSTRQYGQRYAGYIDDFFYAEMAEAGY